MHITVILIAAISLYSGFSYALEENIIDHKDLISHLVTIGASITAIAGVLITLNASKRNLEKSLHESEKRHEESLKEAKNQFLTQMAKIEERNKVEDFHRFIKDLEENNRKIEEIDKKSGEIRRLEKEITISNYSLGIIHKDLKRTEIPKLNKNTINNHLISLSHFKRLCIELDDFINGVDKDRSFANNIILLNSLLTGPLFGLVDIKNSSYKSIKIGSTSKKILKAESQTYAEILKRSIQCIVSALYIGRIYGSIEEKNAMDIILKLNEFTYNAKTNISFEEIERRIEVDLKNEETVLKLEERYKDI